MTLAVRYRGTYADSIVWTRGLPGHLSWATITAASVLPRSGALYAPTSNNGDYLLLATPGIHEYWLLRHET